MRIAESAPIALSMGEPAGIGGEITLKAWLARDRGTHPFFVLDDPDRLARLAKHFGLSVPIAPIETPAHTLQHFSRSLPVLPLGQSVTATPGLPGEKTAAAVIQSIEKSVALAQAGEVAGVVTNPIQKSILYKAGFAYPGHTEFIGALSGGTPVMMLVSPRLKVVPLTIHLPLSQVPSALNTEKLVTTARILEQTLKHDFGIACPRITVAGLNPHAGEGGMLGKEEKEIIVPALEQLRQEGQTITGPAPADTLFHAGARTTYDSVICMYHDQALIPFKTLDPDQGVNVTAGLKIVRTSPDHGTACDIAAQGIANPASLVEAIRLASDISTRRANR